MTKPIQVWDGDGRSPEELAAEEEARLAAAAKREFDASQGGLPIINVQIQSTPVNSPRRKLKARLSPEAAKDLADMHGVDLSKALEAEVQRAMKAGTFTPP